MNERQARKEGLQFTGTYEHFKRELVIEEAARIRKLGFRAVVVNGSSGDSVYAAAEYFQAMAEHERWQRAVNGIKSEEERIERLDSELRLAWLQLEESKKLAAQPEPLKVANTNTKRHKIQWQLLV